MNSMLVDPASGLMLPRQFVDEKMSLKKVIDELVERTVLDNQRISHNYFLTLHAKFDKLDSTKFVISPPIITSKLPPFISNQMVFFISNSRGICEMLWMVTRGKDRKLKVDFNTKGVAYLQAKGAMPT